MSEKKEAKEAQASKLSREECLRLEVAQLKAQLLDAARQNLELRAKLDAVERAALLASIHQQHGVDLRDGSVQVDLQTGAVVGKPGGAA